MVGDLGDRQGGKRNSELGQRSRMQYADDVPISVNPVDLRCSVGISGMDGVLSVEEAIVGCENIDGSLTIPSIPQRE